MDMFSWAIYYRYHPYIPINLVGLFPMWIPRVRFAATFEATSRVITTRYKVTLHQLA
jgi:hypothetical protein